MKKLNNLFILILIFFLNSNILNGQESSPLSKEIYLYGKFLDFGNLGLEYKSELKEGTFLRIGINRLNFNFDKTKTGLISSNNYPTKFSNLTGRFEIGIERRKNITDKLSAFYGVDVFTEGRFMRNKSENPNYPADLRFTDDLTVTPGLSFNSGFILNIKGAFSIATVLAPEIAYTYSSKEMVVNSTKVKATQNEGSLNIGNQYIQIGLIYKWDKK